MARTSLGDQAAEIPFVIPVESAVATVITFVDSAGDPLDQSGSSWVVEVFATSDPSAALLSIAPTVSVGTFTLSASEAAVTAALGSRGQLRWRLRNTSISQDVLAGDVVRTSRGYGAKVGAGTGVTVQVTDTAVTVQGPAATVVAASDVDLSYTASPTGGTVSPSGAGDDATLTLADGTNAGLMAPAQHTKLAGIATGATDDTTVNAHIADTSAAHAITNIGASVASIIAGRVTAGAGDLEELTAAQVRTLINVADGATTDATVDAHIADATGAHAASAVSFTPASGIAATDAQSAIVEALTDAQTYADSAVSTHSTDTTSVHGIADTSALETTTGAQAKADAAQAAAVQRANHTGTQLASTISDFAAATAATAAVTANTAKVTNATHTGDVTGATALTIADDAVTNAKLANVATSTIKGRVTAATGDPEDLTATQVRTLLNVEDGADVTDTANVTAAGALMDSEVDADIKTLALPANTTISTFGASLVDDADAATARTTLGVAIGTDVQAQDDELAAIAGLTSAADRVPYFTGSGTASLATFTAAGRALVDDADAAAQRTTLGLGTIATQAANNVAITGGSVSGITDLAIADGGTGASTAAAARQNLQAMGPVYDVSAYANPTAAHTALKAAGGGILYFPPGAHTIATGLTHDVRDAEDGPLTVIAWGATITYSGSGTMFQMSCPVTAASGWTSPHFYGGTWLDGGSGVVGFQLRDIRGARFMSCTITGFSTACIELFNDYAWCELNHILHCSITADRHAIYFNPQSVNASVNGGTESFARTHVNNLRVGAGETGYALIHCAGGVYDSVFRDIGGNLASGQAVNVFHVEGAMGGTIIDGLGFEFGAGGSALFDVGTFTGSAPLIGAFRAANPIVTYSQDSPALTRMWDAQAPRTVKFVTFDGTAGENITTPDAAALDITGDIEITARVGSFTLDDEHYFISKWTSSRSFFFRSNSTGTLRFSYSTTGANFIAADSTASWVPSTHPYVRCDRTLSTGDVRFWISTDGITWTQLGATVSTTAGQAMYSGTSVMSVGTRDETTWGTMNGQLYWVELRDGIGGVVAARFDASDAANMSTAWTGRVDGLTWTPDSGLALTTVDGPAPFTVTNLTTDRTFDADTVTTAELADVVGTLISDLKAYGAIL